MGRIPQDHAAAIFDQAQLRCESRTVPAAQPTRASVDLASAAGPATSNCASSRRPCDTPRSGARGGLMRSAGVAGSPQIRHVDAGSCNGCETEISGAFSPVYDADQFGACLVASPRHADALLVTGVVTQNMAQPLRNTVDAVPPRAVSSAPRSSTHAGSTGRHCPSPWPTRSLRTSHSSTRASTFLCGQRPLVSRHVRAQDRNRSTTGANSSDSVSNARWPP